MARTDGFDLNEQITARIKGRKRVVEKLQKKQDERTRKEQEKQQEWERKQDRLRSITDKCKALLSKPHRGTSGEPSNHAKHAKGSQCNPQFFKRYNNPSSHSSIANLIKERAEKQKTDRVYEVISSYVEKVDKIEQNKKKREDKFIELMDKKKHELVEKQEKQGQIYERQKSATLQALDEYAKQMQSREGKAKEIMEVSERNKTGLENRYRKAKVLEGMDTT